MGYIQFIVSVLRCDRVYLNLQHVICASDPAECIICNHADHLLLSMSLQLSNGS